MLITPTCKISRKALMYDSPSSCLLKTHNNILSSQHLPSTQSPPLYPTTIYPSLPPSTHLYWSIPLSIHQLMHPSPVHSHPYPLLQPPQSFLSTHQPLPPSTDCSTYLPDDLSTHPLTPSLIYQSPVYRIRTWIRCAVSLSSHPLNSSMNNYL